MRIRRQDQGPPPVAPVNGWSRDISAPGIRNGSDNGMMVIGFSPLLSSNSNFNNNGQQIQTLSIQNSVVRQHSETQSPNGVLALALRRPVVYLSQSQLRERIQELYVKLNTLQMFHQIRFKAITSGNRQRKAGADTLYKNLCQMNEHLGIMGFKPFKHHPTLQCWRLFAATWALEGYVAKFARSETAYTLLIRHLERDLNNRIHLDREKRNFWRQWEKKRGPEEYRNFQEALAILRANRIFQSRSEVKPYLTSSQRGSISYNLATEAQGLHNRRPLMIQYSSESELDRVLQGNRTASSVPNNSCWKEPLKDVLKTLRTLPESSPFKVPVDPVGLNIPDYFEVIIRPMDLSTIEQKLQDGNYGDPWDFIEDFMLMIENAWHYNGKKSPVGRLATKLRNAFDIEMATTMVNLGYCCGKLHSFDALPLQCSTTAGCSIPKDAIYYSYDGSKGKYLFCLKCYKDAGGTINIAGCDGKVKVMVTKDQFTAYKNNVEVNEPVVLCKLCRRKFHQMCVLFIDEHEYTCDMCCKSNDSPRPRNIYSAQNLPSSRLSNSIEARIAKFIRGQDVRCGKVFIRIVSSIDKVVDVKPMMKRVFVDSGHMSAEFPYRAKALLAFQVIDGTEVCFFGMHVQEYGSNSAPPNARRVYIAYLDSVKYFQPSAYRSAIYHEILLGYLDFVKKLGFEFAHIWACPPLEGDDYMFHSHPKDQKNLKTKKLQEWYTKMLTKGITEQIVIDYQDIFKHVLDNHITSLDSLPYFEGDYWPTSIEETIQQLDRDDEKRKLKASYVSKNATTTQISKSQLKRRRSNSDSECSPPKTRKIEDSLNTNIFDRMKKQKEVIVIRLHSSETIAKIPAIVDPDGLINCSLFDGREGFLNWARARRYEFSTLRRAKFSTLALLKELSPFRRCHSCEKKIQTGFACQICPAFYLCSSCQTQQNHMHNMDFRPDLLNPMISREALRKEWISKVATTFQKVFLMQRKYKDCQRRRCHGVNCARCYIPKFLSHHLKRSTCGSCAGCSDCWLGRTWGKMWDRYLYQHYFDRFYKADQDCQAIVRGWVNDRDVVELNRLFKQSKLRIDEIAEKLQNLKNQLHLAQVNWYDHPNARMLMN